MDNTTNKIYTDITIEDEATICFPDEVVGALRPGSLDHLTKVRNIAWGRSMTALIEPGVIPDCCTKLLLPVTYSHPIASSEFGFKPQVYIHHSNITSAAPDLPFFVWKSSTDADVNLPSGFSWNARWSRWIEDWDFLVSVRRAQPIPQRSGRGMMGLGMEELDDFRERSGQDMMGLDTEELDDPRERARDRKRSSDVINDQIALWKWAVAEAKKPADLRPPGFTCDPFKCVTTLSVSSVLRSGGMRERSDQRPDDAENVATRSMGSPSSLISPDLAYAERKLEYFIAKQAAQSIARVSRYD